jgi:adenylosuccinate synthase
VPKRIVLLSGPIASGKTSLAAGIETAFGATTFSTGDLLAARLGDSPGRLRAAQQDEGDALDVSTKGRWVGEELARAIQPLQDDALVVVDAVRTAEQIESVRQLFGPRAAHIHLIGPPTELARRYRKSARARRDGAKSYAEATQNQTEQQVEQLRHVADAIIDTARATPDDVLVRACSRLGLYPSRTPRLVDVVVGGEYGSEGKGHVVSYLAREYGLLVRVGGPNAGHSVMVGGEKYVHHQLPSGTRTSEAKLLIAPGAVIDVDKLLLEIADCAVGVDRLSIDPQAMVISAEDITKEKALVAEIGSTGQGVGAATARRVMGRATDAQLARDVRALQPYIKPAQEVLGRAFARSETVLLEGTQGTELSLYHGTYPYVTSRDTTVSGCLSEAGVAPNRVRRVIMTCRTYPIRVQSPKNRTSGPIAREITWTEVSRRSGIPVARLQADEKTSTTKRRRRVGEFDWALLRRASLLNGPTDIALTFADYLAKQNENARRFDQLTPDTIEFIEEVETVAAAPVTLISTRFHVRGIIDRRSW